jgi:hypothetical protein
MVICLAIVAAVLLLAGLVMAVADTPANAQPGSAQRFAGVPVSAQRGTV